MAFGEFYRQGLASITVSPDALDIVRGNGTLWTAYVVAGDFFCKQGKVVPIIDVIDDETLQLAEDWPGDPFTDETYEILLGAAARLEAYTLASDVTALLARIRALFGAAVPLYSIVEFGVSSPPVGALTGEHYVVIASGASGDFAGQENAIATKTTNGWSFSDPEFGWHIVSETDGSAENIVRFWDGDQWLAAGALAAAPTYEGIWSSLTAYKASNIVARLGILYIAEADTTNEAPESNPSVWTALIHTGEDGSAVVIHYTFKTSTTATVANTAGQMNANAALGSTPTMLRVSKTDIYGTDWSTLFTALATASSSTIKGKLRVVVVGDQTKQFLADVTAIASAGSSTRFDMTISTPLPYGTISDGASVVFIFDPKGDKGDTGSTGATGPTGPHGGAYAIPFVFSTTTTDSDPGSGFLRLDAGTQTSALTIRADNNNADASVISALIDAIANATATPLAVGRLVHRDTPTTKWLNFEITAVASPTGYRNITIQNVTGSSANPFADADPVVLHYVPLYKGDAGATGAQGEQGEPFDPDHVVATLELRAAYDSAAALTSVLVEEDSSNDNLPTLYFLLTPAGPSPDITAVWSQGFNFAPGADASTVTYDPADAAALSGLVTVKEAIDELAVLSTTMDVAEVDVASAATTDFSAVESKFIRVTGATGITAITMAANQKVFVRWNAAGAITHNASTLPLVGGVSRTNVAGSWSMFAADASAVVREVFYNGANFRFDIDQALTAAQQKVAQSNAGVQKQATAIASAATTDIWAVAGDSVHVTGTTTITSFGTAARAGLLRWVVFDGALTITRAALTLETHTTADIKTAAGDRALVYADTTSKAIIVDYKRATGVGEFIKSEIVSGSSVSMTNNTDITITSISLPPGTWLIFAQVAFDTTSTTDFTSLAGGVSTTTNTLPGVPDITMGAFVYRKAAGVLGTNGDTAWSVPMCRMVLTTTTTVYLVASAIFSASTCKGYGYIGASRVA